MAVCVFFLCVFFLGGGEGQWLHMTGTLPNYSVPGQASQTQLHILLQVN